MIFHLISKKPVLVIGNGARSAEISELIYEFINKTHIPVLTSMNTVDMVQDDYRIGFIGTYGNRISNMILNNKMAMDLVTKAYRDMAQEAREKDDFRTESWAMTSGTLQACRVDILTQYSLLLTMVSLLEEAVNTLCRIHKDLGQFTTELKDVKGAGLERAAKYLKDVVGISGFKADQSWEYITTIRDCRNMVVHNGGRIKDDLKPKCDKFNIGYREEDSQLYIEYADVMKFYEAILDFMDRAFRLEPSTSTQP